MADFPSVLLVLPLALAGCVSVLSQAPAAGCPWGCACGNCCNNYCGCYASAVVNDANRRPPVSDGSETCDNADNIADLLRPSPGLSPSDNLHPGMTFNFHLGVVSPGADPCKQ